MLKLQFKDHRKPAIWLVDSRYSIGRDKSNDIILDEEGVAGFHAELQVEEGDRIFLTNAGSTSGTWVNDKQISARTQLRANDKIRISGVELELLDPKEELQRAGSDADATAMTPALQGLEASGSQKDEQPDGAVLRARTGSLVGQEFPVPVTGHVVIGRSRNCDIVLPSNHVSRQHARLYFHGGDLWVKDLESSNGTYVNRKKVQEGVLHNGDELRFDTLVFEVVLAGQQKEASEADTTQFSSPVGTTPEKPAAQAASGTAGGNAAASAPGGKPGSSAAGQARTAEAAPAAGGSEDPAPSGGKGGGGLLWLSLVVLFIAVGGGLAAWWFTRG